MTDLERRLNKIELTLQPEQQIHIIYIFPGETEIQALTRYQEENQKLVRSNDIKVNVKVIRSRADVAAEIKED